MIKDWLSSLIQSFSNLISWLASELGVLLHNVVSLLVYLYNGLQTVTLNLVSSLIEFVLGYMPNMSSEITSGGVNTIRTMLFCWNSILPISEMLSILLFFLSWELVKNVIAAIHYVLGWIKAVTP